MSKKEHTPLISVLAAGVLSVAALGLLWLSLFTVPFVPILFGIAVNIPILFVLFAYGAGAGIGVAALATALLCALIPLKYALLAALFFFAPALAVGWLLGLKSGSHAYLEAAKRRKPAPTRPQAHKTAGKTAAEKPASPATQAYPLSAALFQLALLVAFVTIAVLFCSFSGAEAERFFDAAAKQIAQFAEQRNFYDIPLQPADISGTLRRFLPILCAVSLAIYGFLFQLAALYGAMRLARQKHILKRPFGYWPADLRMPPLALFLFVGLWLLSYFTGGLQFAAAPTLALCLNVILSVLAVGFCVSGLAILHQVTRGPWLWLRIIIYICLFSLVLTPVIFFGLVIMGLFATPFSSQKP